MGNSDLNVEEIERQIYGTFANIATMVGYSELHGKIIGALVVESEPVALQEVAERIGYSISMISLSLDFLEVIGIVRKIKKPADRKLYIELQGDLLETLKKTITMKVGKSVRESLAEFEKNEVQLEKMGTEKSRKILKALKIMEKEIKRLDSYITLLSSVELP